MTQASPKPGGISIHAVDIASGRPAANLSVLLRRIDPDGAEIARGVCAATGHFDHPVATGAGVTRGLYEVSFGVSAYYRAMGMDLPQPAFLEDALFRFGIDHVSEHFHIPFKFTPWGFSLFRGGA